MKKTYQVNLRGIKLDSYKENPVVCMGFGEDIGSIVGRAKILNRKSVEVEFEPGAFQELLMGPAFRIGRSLVTVDGAQELLTLAIVQEFERGW